MTDPNTTNALVQWFKFIGTFIAIVLALGCLSEAANVLMKAAEKVLKGEKK